jgi:hypothetical protein
MPELSAPFHTAASTPTRSDLVRVISEQLGVNHTGVTAIYFGDTQDWEILVGDQLWDRLNESGDAVGFQVWKQSLESRATETSAKMIAAAQKNTTKDKPVTDAQKHYFRVAMMLAELVEAFAPK